MSYVLVTSNCFCCKQIFSYSPTKVPSLLIHGRREPVCRECMEAGNEARRKKGLPEFKINPGAYEADHEDEVPWPQD